VGVTKEVVILLLLQKLDELVPEVI